MEHYEETKLNIEGEQTNLDTGFQMLESGLNKRISITSVAFFEDRPTNTIFLETSREQDVRVKAASPYGSLKSWKLLKIIVKSNDDVRQEQFAMQLIS